MADRTLISYSRRDRPYAREPGDHVHREGLAGMSPDPPQAALAARRVRASGVWAAGALLVLLLALGSALLEQWLDVWSWGPQPAATTVAARAPTRTPTPEPTPVPIATASATPATIPPRTSPPARTPVTRVREKDGAVMVYVPAGAFWMGSDENDPAARSLEGPRHSVRVGAFWIDRTEVTNAQYRRCVDAGVCSPPQKTDSMARAPYYGNAAYDGYPVVNVTWHQAVMYARWVGGRLPTEAEWEYVARGPAGSTYPWGEYAPDERLLNYSFNMDDTTPVGAYPEGASWCGALDMSGNVWEWTSSLFQSYPYDPADGREDPEANGRRVLRGGAFVGDAENVRCALRACPAPGYWDWLCGFRVVVDSPQ